MRDGLAGNPNNAAMVASLDGQLNRLRTLENRFFGFVLLAKPSDAQLKKLEAGFDAEFAVPGATPSKVVAQCVAALNKIDAGG